MAPTLVTQAQTLLSTLCQRVCPEDPIEPAEDVTSILTQIEFVTRYMVANRFAIEIEEPFSPSSDPKLEQPWRDAPGAKHILPEGEGWKIHNGMDGIPYTNDSLVEVKLRAGGIGTGSVREFRKQFDWYGPSSSEDVIAYRRINPPAAQPAKTDEPEPDFAEVDEPGKPTKQELADAVYDALRRFSEAAYAADAAGLIVQITGKRPLRPQEEIIIDQIAVTLGDRIEPSSKA